MPDVTSIGENYPVLGAGGKAQISVPLAAFGLAGPVPANGNIVSDIIPSCGLTAIAVGITSSQAGQVTIQQYLDVAGTILAGAAVTGALVGGTPLVVTASAVLIFRSFKITITNTTGTAANLTNTIVVQQA